MNTYQIEMAVTKGKLQALLELEVSAPTEHIAYLLAGELAVELLGDGVEATTNGATLVDT